MGLKNIILGLFCLSFYLGSLSLGFSAESCAAAAKNLQQQSKGRILSVKETSANGKKLCVIDILVPGKEGNPPRKKRFTVN